MAWLSAVALAGAFVLLAACSPYKENRLDIRIGDNPRAGRSGASPSPAGSGGGSGASAGGSAAGTGGRPPVPAAGRMAPDAQIMPVPDAGPSADAAADAEIPDACAAPSACGCGVPELDGDDDGTPDCIDECPADGLKTAPGMCGCGMAETDGDNDGTPDCVDGCPSDGAKTAPGVCGCGVPESDQGASAGCTGLREALIHRYRFDGTGTSILDTRGGANGSAKNVSLTGTGRLELAGGSSNEFVDLPNRLISVLTDATFEAWVTWNGGAAWQRIFDFGDNSASSEGNQGSSGRSYLFLTTLSARSGTTVRAAFTIDGPDEETAVNGSAAFPTTGGMHHVAVVIDDAGDHMQLFLDGASVSQVAFSGQLSAINDINNWLGRSQFSSDPDFAGALHEFRIYNKALSAAQIELSFDSGPEPAFLNDF